MIYTFMSAPLLLAAALSVSPVALPQDDARPVTPPKPVAGAGSFMLDNAYPVDALRERQEGLSVVSLAVNEKGKVTACRVSETSGSTSLDNATCSMGRKMHYAPARDAVGNAVTGEAPFRMNWHLPSR